MNLNLFINIDGYGTINYYYSCNHNSTFYDLLESISFTLPNLNICPCYRIQFNNQNNNNINSYFDVNMNQKIEDYTKNNIQYYRVYRKKNILCYCNKIYKDNFRKSKMEILNILEKYKNELESKEDQIIELNNTINEKIKIITDLENNYSKINKESNNIPKLCKKIESLEKDIENKNNEINNLNNEISIKDNEIKKYKSDLADKEKQIEKLIQDKSKMADSVSKVIKTMNSFGYKNDIANQEINDLKDLLEKQKEQHMIDSQKMKALELENMKLNEERLRSEKANKDTNFIDFYDVIVDIKSIKDISKGWVIKMNEKAKTNYENFKKEKVIKIGVIGNANKGKSFLLSKISKIILPSGTSIRTEGLSIKYPELEDYKNRKIVLLDSAGLETPVLKEEKKLETNKEEEKIQVNDKEEEKKNDLNKENDEKEYFREKSREKLITELFLQNYIINNSDILIIVVGILTYSEQKLLNRIKTEIIKMRNKTKINKPLFIIHNLVTYKTIDQVEEYCNDFLLKSATFDLEKGHNISTDKKERTGAYFYEKLTNQEIYHLIFAHDGSDAGKYYNKLTLDFIENSFQHVINIDSYDVIETLKDCFIDSSKDFLEKTEKVITKENFEIQDNLIKLSNANNVTLKKCFIDELGFSSLKSNVFEPSFCYFKKDNNIIVKVEIPGNYTIKPSLYHLGEFNYIKLTGLKKPDKEPKDMKDYIDNTREFGKFSFNIPLRVEDYHIKNKEPKIWDKKGIIFFEYELEEKMPDIVVVTNEEDEV